MSLYACMLATRNKLREELKFSDNEICITEREGRPPATGWNTFIAIWGTDWRPDEPDLDLGLSELYSFSVTITQRVNAIAQDRIGTDMYVSENLETEKVVRKIIIAIHKQYDIITAANDLIDAETYNQIMEPFRWRGGDAVPILRDASWLKTWAPDHITDPQLDCFLTLQLDFGGAKRMQATHTSGRTVS